MSFLTTIGASPVDVAGTLPIYSPSVEAAADLAGLLFCVLLMTASVVILSIGLSTGE